MTPEKSLEKLGSMTAFFSDQGSDLALQWLSTLFVAGISFLVSVMLARTLGVEGFGTYSYLLSLAGLFMILQDGGYKTLLFRESIGGSGKRVLPLGIGHVFIMTLAGAGIVLLFQPQEWPTLLAAVFCMGMVALTEFVSSGLKGEGRFKLDALWKGIIRIATAATISWAILFYKSDAPASIFLGWGLALLIVLCWPLVKGWLCRPVFRLRGDLIRANIAFLTIDVATIIYFRSDIVLLKYLGHELQDIGQYAVACRVLEGIILLATPASQLAFRALRLRWLEGNGFPKLCALLLGTMFLVAIIIVVLNAFWGEALILLVFGSSYIVAGVLFFWLSLSLIFLLPNYILTQSAIAMGCEKGYAWVALGTALLNIVLNLFWIPRFGVMGAVWSTIAAEGCLFLGLGWILLGGWRSHKC